MFYRKDWILYQEVQNDGGKKPEDLLDVKAKIENPDDNKHVPFIEEQENGYLVKTGKNEYHATDSEHYIIFIELQIDDEYVYRKYIKKGEKPEVIFNVPKGKKVVSYAFCNLHGLWTYKL